jgi:hypothetical protein
LRDAFIYPSDRALALDYWVEAQNANAVDEVPDSSWFVDRRRDRAQDHAKPRSFSAAEMSRGPFAADDNGPTPPFTITKGKTIGSTPGVVIEDAHHTKYLIKLDPPGWLGMNTSTEVVATRLAWAAGWLVPAEKLIDLRESDLILSPTATAKDEWGQDIPLTAAKLSELLSKTPRQPDGTLRGCASLWLPGKSIGSWGYVGRRKDDGNDHIPHQERRDVRGFGIFAAWVNDIDTMENNTMDSYVGKPGEGHVIHYQQDVGGSFGQFAAIPSEVWMGDETYFMPGRIFLSLLTLGAIPRSWEGGARAARRKELMERYNELGYFDDRDFNPRSWHPILDNPAFVRQTTRDRYWGTKRVIAFTETEVRAAVALGHYAPATAERLFEILWSRRERIARTFLSDVAPLDYFRFAGAKLCFDDLWIDAGLGGDAPRYQVKLDGRRREAVSERCVDLAGASGYHVVELGARRGSRPPAYVVNVHVVVDASGPRVIGVAR